jgi:hypothetical protein
VKIWEKITGGGVKLLLEKLLRKHAFQYSDLPIATIYELKSVTN